MSIVRPPALAGTFYERDAAALNASVTAFLRMAMETAPQTAGGAAPTGRAKAVIAPHAGHVYSGPAAARAYLAFAGRRDDIRRIVLLGPTHRVPVRGFAATSADYWATPLGRVPIDRQAVEAALSLPHVAINDEAHAREHSLEVHLPFLQRLFPEFSLVPFAVGEASAEEVSGLLDLLWGGPETAIVISSDLSHFLDYETARGLDASTAEAIEALDETAIGRDQACGRIPISGLLRCARQHQMHATRLSLINSGDTAGARDRVVGYGAWAFQ